MKTKAVSFMVEKLRAIKQRITEMTNDFIRLVKDKQKHDERCLEFDVKNDEWNSHSNMQKVRWFLVLLIVVPILILVDYASLKLFIEYLQYSVNNYAVSKVLEVLGIIIFFILELAICFSIIRINESLEREPNRALKFVKVLLTIIMITLPSILIYTGYLLLPSPSPGDTMKTFALILLSLAIHTALFILIDDVLRAITYIVFLIRRRMLKRADPTKYIEKLKKELLKCYSQYDIEAITLSELPDSAVYLPIIKLSTREQLLRDRLEEGMDEDDYDEFVSLKSHSPKPPFSGSGSAGSTSTPLTSSTVW
jgi:hypothetical protein